MELVSPPTPPHPTTSTSCSNNQSATSFSSSTGLSPSASIRVRTGFPLKPLLHTTRSTTSSYNFLAAPDLDTRRKPPPKDTTMTRAYSVVSIFCFHPPVPALLDQAKRQVTSTLSTSAVRHFPTSVLLQEQHDDWRPYDKLNKVALDRLKLDIGTPYFEEKSHEFNEYLRYFEGQLLYQPGLSYISPPFIEEEPLPSMQMEILATEAKPDVKLIQMPGKKDNSDVVRLLDALTLAKKAMLASQEAATLAENSYHFGIDLDESHFHSLANSTQVEKPTVRSGRLLERLSKKRRASKKPNMDPDELSSSVTAGLDQKISKGLDSNDPLRLFLAGPETRQLLTVKEERDLFSKIQDLMRVQEVKLRLRMQFVREPTYAEWAEAVGMSTRDLQSCLDSGSRSREKMIYANFRLVVHVAKQYQRKGLDIQDLLQVGGMGLMKSLEKFKPKAGCRFPTYAYWWIRQSIKKAIFQNSRTIRLPENVFALLKKIKNTRRLYIQEEGHYPTNQDLAKRVGVTVEKLERLLISSRTPISIQECAWTDQDVTFQEITADPEIETPDLCISKQMMRQHVRNLLRVLPKRERQIIQLRYGIYDVEQKTLSDIGTMYGVSKERVRQLESRALDKLKDCLSSQGLDAYVHLLI